MFEQSNDHNQEHGSCHAGLRQFLVAGMGVIAMPSLATAAFLPGRTSMATILIDKNVVVPMRDGVRLARTPYDKERIAAASDTSDILRAVQAGYVVVVQDCRSIPTGDQSHLP
ncbi:MAG TPA: hypothetical protein VIS96_00380 [Terrimicrobiaceae bacterium]